MGIKENYSDFKFYDAMSSDLTTAARTGESIDLRGYRAATLIVNGFSCDSGLVNSVADCYKYILQHGLASAAGVSTWSNVPGSQLIHSVYGGYDSTAETGLFAYGFASTMGISNTPLLQEVGYKMDTKHRYLRFFLSISGNPSAAYLGAVMMLGRAGDWPVIEAV